MNKCRSGIRAAIWVLGIAMTTAVLPGIPARSDIAFAQGIGQASYGGVTLSYDNSLATAVRGQAVASNVGQNTIPSEIRPQHISFSFDGYPSKGVWTPQIRVIPLGAYRAAQSATGVSAELSGLEKYLGGATSAPLPQLPPVNAQRIISEDVAPIDGAGVSGVRFIASYSQAIVPVSGDNITYMFIGLSADRQYYVEGTFPVSLNTPLDPAPSPMTTENVQAYNQAVAERLSKTDMSGFTPTLDKLDKMMASIQVAQTIPGMPTTGTAPDSTWLLLSGVAAGVLTLAVGMTVRRRQGPRSGR